MGIRLAEAERALGSGDEETRRAAVAGLEADLAEADRALALLIFAMGDESWRVRKEAAARAGAWPDRPRAAAALTSALAEPDNVGRRNAAIEALVALGGEAVGPIETALATRPEHRKVLADTLGLIGERSGTAPLAALLDDEDANVRIAAAEALGAIGGAAAEEALAGALESWRGDRLLTRAALDALNRAGARLALGELVPLLAEPTLRAPVVTALGRAGDEAGLGPLVIALGDRARSVREAAIVALADLYARANPEAQARIRDRMAQAGALEPVLVPALLEGTAGVQRAAARVLGLTGRRQAIRPLALALGDPELREAALSALAAIGPTAVEALIALAPDLEGRLKAEVYSLLPQLGPPAADPRVEAHLIGALTDDDGEAATQAALALGALGGRASLAPLFRALERDEASAHAAATALGRLGTRHYDEVRILLSSRGLVGPEAPHLCRVLGACGREADAPALKAALGAESPAIRRAAAEALAELPLASGPELVAALLFALADESADVRAAAAHALGAHVQAPFGPALDALERAAHDLEVAVRAQAARALGALARRAILEEKNPGEGARARPLAVLRRLADAPEVVAAVPALEALGALGDPADDPRLLTALESPDAEIVKAAARALGARHGALSAADARAALERALTDRRWDVRRAAALALGAHGPVAHPLLYARRTVERDPLVLDAIDRALGRALGRALDDALDEPSSGGGWPRGARG